MQLIFHLSRISFFSDLMFEVGRTYLRKQLYMTEVGSHSVGIYVQ